MVNIEIETANLFRKLARKGNWDNCYDRLEHFKRFSNLKEIIKIYNNKKWLIIKKKPNYTGISLNTQFKKGIIDFVEKNDPSLSGYIHSFL